MSSLLSFLKTLIHPRGPPNNKITPDISHRNQAPPSPFARRKGLAECNLPGKKGMNKETKERLAICLEEIKITGVLNDPLISKDLQIDDGQSPADFNGPNFFPRLAVVNFRRNHINRSRPTSVKLLDALTTGCPNRIRPQRLLYRDLKYNARYSES